MTAPESAPTRPLEEIVTELLRAIGENPDRQGLLNTPKRVATSLRYLTRGYGQDVGELINEAVFDVSDAQNVTYDEMVVCRDVDFFSMCEHHMLPFFGRAHVAYIPTGKVLGLSKLARIVDVYARRLQVQERMTMQIAKAIEDSIQPLGVAVVVEGTHLCMVMRGVEKANSKAVTSAMLGDFQTDPKTREEFMTIIGGSLA